MECETLYQRYRKLTLDTSLPTASTTYSRVGSLKNIFHNTTVTNSNEGSPICLKCGGPVHLDENLCPSVAFLEGYMYAQRQHQHEPRNGDNDGVAKKKKRRRRPKMLYQMYRPTPPEPQPLIQTKNARKRRRRRARRRLMNEQIRKEKKRQEWIIREAKIREEAKTREETITRESRPQEEEEQARLMSLGYAPTRVYQSEAYMFYQLLTRHNGCFTFMLVLL
ncbi:hypothetical protein AFLA_007751 [Aspergillus flavus NRRL3357]|nr:hypothetical protein AFLA_007751 [Aspergillus flavus NRRL3357]